MFKKHSIQLSVVKTPKDATSDQEAQKPFMTPDEMNTIIKDSMKRTAITCVAVMAASVVLHTVSELILRAADANDQDDE